MIFLSFSFHRRIGGGDGGAQIDGPITREKKRGKEGFHGKLASTRAQKRGSSSIGAQCIRGNLCYFGGLPFCSPMVRTCSLHPGDGSDHLRRKGIQKKNRIEATSSPGGTELLFSNRPPRLSGRKKVFFGGNLGSLQVGSDGCDQSENWRRMTPRKRKSDRKQ